ncbi:unnamed protein product [Brassica oleracea]
MPCCGALFRSESKSHLNHLKINSIYIEIPEREILSSLALSLDSTRSICCLCEQVLNFFYVCLNWCGGAGLGCILRCLSDTVNIV